MSKKCVMIITPMLDELQGIAEGFGVSVPGTKKGVVHEHKLGGVRLLFTHIGVGRKASLKTCRKLLPVMSSVSLAIFAGTAGGLSEDVNAGDVFVVDKVVTEDGEERKIDISIGLSQFVRTGVYTSSGAAGVNEKQAMGSHVKDGYGLVDMESFFIADFCQENKIEFSIIRCVSDALSDCLPDYLFLSNWERASLLRKVFLLLKNPIDSWNAIKYKKRFLLSINNIKSVLKTVVNECKE